MNVDIIDLCEDSDYNKDDNYSPRDIDTSHANATLLSTQETPKRKTSAALSSSDNVIYFHMFLAFLPIIAELNWFSYNLQTCSNSGTNSVENSAEKVLPKKITPKQSKESTPMRKEERDLLKQV